MNDQKCWGCNNGISASNVHNKDCSKYNAYPHYSNQFCALIVKTDTEHWGHQWVVITAVARENVHHLKGFMDFYSSWENLNALNCQIVTLCSDTKAHVGALVCEDEFN